MLTVVFFEVCSFFVLGRLRLVLWRGRIEGHQNNAAMPVRSLPTEPHPRVITPPGRSVVNFYSGAGGTAHRFSNFSYCPEGVLYKGRVYPTAEHAYVAQKYRGPTQQRFAVGGDLTRWASMRLFVRPKRGETPEDHGARVSAKIAHWSKKGNLGVLAKMAGNPAHAKHAGLPPPKKVRQGIFYKIARSKYTRDPALAALLLATGDAHLIEFARGARAREQRGGEPERWAALVDKDGRIWGDNRMGLVLMLLREHLNLNASH